MDRHPKQQVRIQNEKRFGQIMHTPYKDFYEHINDIFFIHKISNCCILILLFNFVEIDKKKRKGMQNVSQIVKRLGQIFLSVIVEPGFLEEYRSE